MKCQICGKEVVHPFQCSYCDGYFCVEHRLPESHSCLKLPTKPQFWYQKRRLTKEKTSPKPILSKRKKGRSIPSKRRKARRPAGLILSVLIIGAVVGFFSWHFFITLPRVQKLQEQATGLETDLNLAIRETTTLKNSLKDLQSEITKLEKERDLLNQEFSSLSLNYTDLERKHEDLQAEYKRLEEEYNGVQTRYKKLSGQYEIIYNSRYEEGYDAGYIRGLAEKGYDIRDPSYKEALQFITSDQTDENEYVEGEYVCWNFAADFKNNAFKSGYRCGLVFIEFEGFWGHSIVCFNTTDEGLIFIEPQDDELVTLTIGHHYWDRSKYLIIYDDTIVKFEIIW